MECNRRWPWAGSAGGTDVHAGARRGRSVSPRDDGRGKAQRASWNDGAVRTRRVAGAAVALAVAGAVAALAATARADAAPPFRSAPLTGLPVSAAGAAASRLARTDPSLVGQLSQAPV